MALAPSIPASSLSPAPRLICVNKPSTVLSQLTAEGRLRGLKDFIDVPGFCVAGRLEPGTMRG